MRIALIRHLVPLIEPGTCYGRLDVAVDPSVDGQMRRLGLQLKAKGINEAWETTRNTLSSQVRITTTLQRRDGRTVHVRNASRPEPPQPQIYAALKLSRQPRRLSGNHPLIRRRQPPSHHRRSSAIWACR
jgi:hypothetical protein